MDVLETADWEAEVWERIQDEYKESPIWGDVEAFRHNLPLTPGPLEATAKWCWTVARARGTRWKSQYIALWSAIRRELEEKPDV